MKHKGQWRTPIKNFCSFYFIVSEHEKVEIEKEILEVMS